MSGADQAVAQSLETLTVAERRVARVVLDDPSAVAFGTVATIAEAAGVSPPTVLRMAAKAGYAGFVELQADIRGAMSTRLAPAASRIGRVAPGDPVARVREAEIANVESTLASLDAPLLDAITTRLAEGRRIVVVAGDELRPVATLFADRLGDLRDGVVLAPGSAVGAVRATATLGRSDTLVVIDLPRYDRDVVAVARAVRDAGCAVVAFSDSRVSPVAEVAAHAVTCAARSPGPFDSHVGVLSALDALVVSVAARLRDHARPRLRRVERAWEALGVYERA